MRAINREQYKQIWNHTDCNQFKAEMSEKYANAILIKGEAEVSEEDYKRARAAAKGRQLDEIFGKDEQEFKVGDHVYFMVRYQTKRFKK